MHLTGDQREAPVRRMQGNIQHSMTCCVVVRWREVVDHGKRGTTLLASQNQQVVHSRQTECTWYPLTKHAFYTC